MAVLGDLVPRSVLAAVLLFPLRTASAAPVQHVALAWSQDDPSCLGSADLVSTVERTLDRPIFHSDAPVFATVVGAVGRRPDAGFQAHIELRDADDKVLAARTLMTARDCGRLDEAIAVVVTLMIDGMEEAPATLLISPAPPRPRVAEAEPQPAPPRPAPTMSPEPVAPPPEPLRLTFGAGTGVSSSLLPGVAVSLGVRGEIDARGLVPIALTLRVHPESSATVAGAGGRFAAWSGELAGCPSWTVSAFRLGFCVGLEGGALSGAYVNLVDGESRLRPLLMVTALPFAAAHLTGPLWVRLAAGPWFPLLRDRWGYLDAHGTFEQLFQPAPVVPAAMLTVEAQVGGSTRSR